MTDSSVVFGTDSESPRDSGDLFSRSEWDSLRDQALPPRTVSSLGSSDADRAEFLRGAALLRLYGDRALHGRSLAPQQLLVADMMAAGFTRNAVLVPRRGTKSTSLIAVGLGRAEAREDYRVGILTLTTGKAGRSRFLRDVAPAIERLYPDRATRPLRIMRGAGQERIEFNESGGSVSWLSTEDDLRGEAFDLVILDEGGEAPADKAESVLGAALPTLLTRPGSQIVVVGTAGDYDVGNLLHDWLAQARTEGGMGVVDYSSPRTLTVEDIATWEQARELVLALHPGIGNVIPDVDLVKSDFDSMTRERFLREFLSVFGSTAGAGFLALPPGLDEDYPAVPRHHRIGISVNVAGNTASMVAVWRDERKRPCVLVLENWRSTEPLYAAARTAFKKWRTPLVVDLSVGAMRAEVHKLKQRATNPRPRFTEVKWPDVAAGATVMKREIDSGNLVHWNQPALIAAVAGAKKRGGSDAKMWAFGRVSPDADITPLEAAANALAAYDTASVSRPLTLVAS